jgi:hypothetical protein
MNIDAKAREILQEIKKGPRLVIDESLFIGLMSTALLSARNEALEDAAKAADASVYEDSTGPYGETVNITSEAIATAIRALKTTTG